MSSPSKSAVFTNLKEENDVCVSVNYQSLENLTPNNFIGHDTQISLYEASAEQQEVQSFDCSFVKTESPKKPKRRKDRGGEVCRKSYKVKWLGLPEVKDWLVILPRVSNYVGCKWCHIKLRAHLHDLKKHAQSKKHRRCMVKYNASNTDQSLHTFEESIALEVADCHDGLSLESNISINHDELVNEESAGHSENYSRKDSRVPVHIGFIGAGNITQSLLSGFLSSGVVEASNIIVSAPSYKNLNKLKSVGIRTTHDNNFVVQECDLVFLAVRSVTAAEVLANLDPINKSHSPLFISIITGLTILHLEGMLSSHSVSNPRVIRLVPNTPCMVLQGLSVYSLGTFATAREGNIIQNILGAVSLCCEIQESQMDAASGLCGSGPAYIYAAIDALADGAVKMGIPRENAIRFAAQMVKGSAAMVLETGRHPCQLKDEVCCPSGNAIAGMHVLEKYGFRNSLMSAVEAAALKSGE